MTSVKDCINGPHYLPTWHSVFRVRIEGQNHPMITVGGAAGALTGWVKCGEQILRPSRCNNYWDLKSCTMVVQTPLHVSDQSQVLWINEIHTSNCIASSADLNIKKSYIFFQIFQMICISRHLSPHSSLMWLYLLCLHPEMWKLVTSFWLSLVRSNWPTLAPLPLPHLPTLLWEHLTGQCLPSILEKNQNIKM